MAKTVQISENNIYSIFKQHKFGYLGGRDFAISDDGLNWSVINHYTDLLLTNPSTALIGDYYYIISDDSFYKTKDFNAFIKLDAQITDDKHTDLHNFEWFKDSNGSWFIKYNATSTNNAVYTYWADFDETTDSFVDAFQQFNLPNGEASGLVKVRGKYYIWQTGDKLFCADDYTGQFKEIATDIAGDTAHKQFSAVVSNNYLYVYYDADGATYERSSKATNLIHWTKPVKVVNVGLGSYFYNEKAVSVYPSFEKKASFNKILKLTANGFEQTVPINCMVPTSLQVQWEQNGSYQISFTAFDDKSVSYTMLSEEADIEFNGQHYIVKQAVEDAGGGIDTKQITATHIYNEISRVRQRNTKTGTLTYSVQDVLSFYLDDKVANPFGFSYSVYGSFDKQQIENLGNSSGSDMLSKITEQWPQAIIYPDNKNIRVYSPESFAKDYGGRIDYLHNSSDVKMTVDSTTITNQVKVFGKQIENTDDNATDNAPVKYYFDPFIVEDKDSIKQYGLHPMDDISDERFTDRNAMQAYAKGQLSPNPAVSIEVTGVKNEMPIAGEQRHLIAKPLNLETDLTVIGYTWNPFDSSQVTQFVFANLPVSILRTQSNINNRIRTVQLMAQQAINSAKTGTRNYISRNDPMQNDSNDVHTGDIWTLPLIQETQSPMSRSVNVQDESTSEKNQTIYTDPDNLTKVDVQLSIWNGSKWLEISNQRTTNKLNDKIDNVANDVAEAQKGIDKAEQDAQNAVDSADKAIGQAGLANDTAATAKETADSVKDDVATAKSDSANALQQAQDAMTNATDAKTTADNIKTDVDTVKGELTSKADKTDVDTISNRVTTNETNITQNSNDIKSKASQSDVNTLTGRVETAESNITQNANDISSKVSSSDVQGILDKGGYATQTWTGSQIDQKANEISSTVTEVSNKVDDLSYENKNLVLSSADNSHIGITDNRYKVFKLSVDEMDSKIFTVSTYLKDIENTDGISIGLSMANANDGLRCVDADIVKIGSNSYASGVIDLSGISNYKDYNCMIIYSGKGNWAGSDGKAITSYNRQVEKGTKATDWTPAPEDLATVTALSKVDQKADSISTTVTNNKTDADSKFTNINQTINGIQSTVANKADSSTVTQLSDVVDSKVSTDDYNSEITQLSDDINLRVKTDELISQINLKSDNVLIQAGSGKGKLYLDGSTVVFSGEAFIPSAAIANIDADKITVSDQFNVNDTFVVDSSGNMIAQNATIAGSIGSNLINSSFENIKQDWKGFMPWWWDDGNISIGNGSIKLDAQAKQSLRTDSELWGDTQWINGELTPSYLKLVSYSQDPALATKVTNLISNNSNDWQQGKVTAQVGMSPKYVNDKNRIVLKENILIAVTSYNQYKVIVSAPYQIIIQEFDSNKKFVRDSGWISGNKDYTTGDKTAFVTVVLSSIKNESITPSDMDNITLQFYNWNDYNQDQNMNGRMYLDATQLSFTTYNGNGHFKVDSTGSLEATGGAYFLGGITADSLRVKGLLTSENNEIIDFPVDDGGEEQRILLYKSLLFENTAERPFIGSANGGYLQFGGDVEFVNFNYGNIGMDTKRYFYVDQANGKRSLLMDSDKATFSGEVSASKLTNRSQESLKRDIQDVDPKNLVRNLYNYKVNSWNYKTESNTVKKHLGGVISDKPNYRVPDVFLDDDGTAINQSNLINALVTTVQEQASQISELYVRLTKLELGEIKNNE
ncbi:MAG TPA: phage tail protein [Ligilactobacillus acidipiscis]|uniref:Phage tail protein n=1 Tax=Ligilactobacillus acidipiscis TaxID=89059 RepID=A0A921K0L4_9LACO|nr:phage tail protein [Ligilactobacillus acidipiscis]